MKWLTPLHLPSVLRKEHTRRVRTPSKCAWLVVVFVTKPTQRMSQNREVEESYRLEVCEACGIAVSNALNRALVVTVSVW